METSNRVTPLQEDIETIEDFIEVYGGLKTECDRLNWLTRLPQVESNIALLPKKWIDSLDDESKCALFSLFTFSSNEQVKRLDHDHMLPFLRFVDQLKEIERFYRPIGGIMGYQCEVLKRIYPRSAKSQALWSRPPGYEIEQAGIEGIDTLPLFAEIYPVGGAGDRLDLKDEETQDPLPAALLPFLGRSLLEGLVRDVQGREYLYEKLFGKKVVTPIALMTSQEKDNERYLQALLEEKEHFGRPKESFFLFKQPQAPMVNKEGVWSITQEWQLQQKPGGHGVIWKLSKDCGLFKWLENHGRRYALIRQINNPIVGLDRTLSTLCGLGVKEKKSFGFLAAPRRPNAPEGVDVLVQEKKDGQWWASILNIEYTDFVYQEINNTFPANTNVLFVDLKAIEEKVDQSPFPGLVYNPKDGGAGRLESLMQNIAETFQDQIDGPIQGDEWKKLSTYVAYNSRKKSISSTKRAYKEGESLDDTPQGAFNDLQENMAELFKSCGMHLEGNPLIWIHPALGPYWSIIRQKVSGGSLKGELELEIAEVEMRDCHIEGSLLVLSGSLEGQCRLIGVKVKNRGVAGGSFWDKKVLRKECLSIELQGRSEFIAENVTFRGNQTIVVPDGYRYVAYNRGEEVELQKERIEKRDPLWRYSLNLINQIEVTRWIDISS